MKITTQILLLSLSIGLMVGLSGCKKTTKEVIHNPVTVKDGQIRNDAPDGPKIQFDESNYNFGTVMQGERLSHTFTFTNKGKKDLVISSVTATCGCTTSTPPRAPIRPGEKGELKVTFDSKTKQGKVKNSVSVATNAYPTRSILTIEADVKKP